MRSYTVLVMSMVAVGAAYACSDDGGGNGMPSGIGGSAGALGGAGSGAGGGGAAGSSGSSGSTGSAGASGTGPVVPPTPALPPGAPTAACPNQFSGSLDTTDSSQSGRHSRIAPAAVCGMPKGSPGTAADPSNPHLYDIYRFANPTATALCFNFTLTYGAGVIVGGGLDAGLDAGALDAGPDGGDDASAGDAAVAPPANAGPARYLTAYSTFFPTAIENSYLGDVGDVLTSPQTMGITVPANGTIDVVVYAIDIAPAGVGTYTLSCATQ